MRTVRTKVYKFSELDDDAKEKAIDACRDGNFLDSQQAWDDIQEDAKDVGLKLITLDDHRPNKGEFMQDADYCAEQILKSHGEQCDTYKTAAKYMDERSQLDIDEQEDELEQLDKEFMHDILEDYRIMYHKQWDYMNSDEYIIETIEANDYEFKKDGTMF